MGENATELGPLEELVAARNVRVCRVASLFVQAWTEEVMLHEHDLIDAAFDEMIARYPEGFCSLTLIRMVKLPGPPDAELRERAQAQAQRLEPYMRASPIVFAGPGLLGRGIRLFMKVLMLKSRSSVPNQVCESLPDALDWMCALEVVDPCLVANRAEVEDTIAGWWNAPR